MKKVTIRHCPVGATIKTYAASLAAELKNQGFDAELTEGERGEPSVFADGRLIAK